VGGGATPTKGGAGEADAAAVARIELCGVTSQLAVQLWSEESEEYMCGRRSATCDVMWTLPIYLAGFSCDVTFSHLSLASAITVSCVCAALLTYHPPA